MMTMQAEPFGDTEYVAQMSGRVDGAARVGRVVDHDTRRVVVRAGHHVL